MKTVGVIGVGAMGKPMAKNLLKKGYSVIIYDVREEPLKELQTLGARVARSPKEVGGHVQVAIVLVFNYPQVEEAVLGETGLVAGLKENSIVVVMSTISPREVKHLANRVEQKGIRVLDAPISGGAARAEAGTLTVIAAGQSQVLEDCRDILETLGTHVYHVGQEIGLGQTVKMVNQLLYCVQTAAVAEAMVLGVKAGADPQVILEVVSQSAGNCFFLQHHVPNILKGNYDGRANIEILRKDIRTVLTTAKEQGVPLFLTSVTAEVLELVKSLRKGEEPLDHLCVVKTLEELAGVSLASEAKQSL